jgi:DNA-directed RNA polymerase specialized sigma24 family protein
MQTQAHEIFWTKSLGDWDLLDRYRTSGSQAAFAELVARHIGLVFGTCRRRLADPQLAEQAAQDVFLMLARRGPIRGAERLLSGWLVQAARQVCRDAPVRRESLLDVSLMSLSRDDLDLLLARYYQGWNLLQVSDAFGISQNSAAQRVSRALARVRQALASHGIVISNDEVASRLLTLNHEPVHRSVVAGIGTAVREIRPAAPATQLSSLLNRAMTVFARWVPGRATA